jgi:hypothetical protein
MTSLVLLYSLYCCRYYRTCGILTVSQTRGCTRQLGLWNSVLIVSHFWETLRDETVTDSTAVNTSNSPTSSFVPSRASISSSYGVEDLLDWSFPGIEASEKGQQNLIQEMSDSAASESTFSSLELYVSKVSSTIDRDTALQPLHSHWPRLCPTNTGNWHGSHLLTMAGADGHFRTTYSHSSAAFTVPPTSHLFDQDHHQDAQQPLQPYAPSSRGSSQGVASQHTIASQFPPNQQISSREDRRKKSNMENQRAYRARRKACRDRVSGLYLIPSY